MVDRRWQVVTRRMFGSLRNGIILVTVFISAVVLYAHVFVIPQQVLNTDAAVKRSLLIDRGSQFRCAFASKSVTTPTTTTVHVTNASSITADVRDEQEKKYFNGSVIITEEQEESVLNETKIVSREQFKETSNANKKKESRIGKHERHRPSHMVIKTKTRRRVTRSSRTLRRLALQQNLTDTVKLLDTNWELNKTRLRGIRHDLTNLNGSYFIFTQSNTKLGRKYYNSFLKSPVVINRPQLRLLPETSPFSETTLFKSCAIVGNGGILKNSHCGNEIDSSDFVMRSNLQPIKHFTNDAGMKSSLVTINPSIIYNRFNLFDTPGNESNFLQALEEYQQYFLWIPNSYVVNNSLSFETASIIRQTIRQQLLLADAIYFRKLQRYWKTKKMLSTGMSLVSIGICLCEEINLYGFWPFQIDSNGEPLPMHYTDDIAWSTYHHNHDYDSEFQLLINLHRSGVIKLHINQCSP